ncbi:MULTISPECIES: endonuclease MutS2 [Aeribacillus]|uniref:Endonuclease MutS2 n=1 Tax=Aeribacillus composti TaxID=1868734 RepID=A0ABY9W846_9BACI|nr:MULTISPECIES: endonuclease MutS2 [Aeribacillus]MED0703873.1 endonuclease MutS2 [Aeribacillus composti]RZI53246.1 endonuclease MutS2 [Aeribacillus pallidus]WNF32321.1 endonuclease MutS2 [Aeribacillus composti]
MQERVLHVLEFNKIRELLKEHASSSLGKEKALKLMPSGDINEVLKRQEQTDEALTVLRLKGSAPFGGLSDIRPSVKRAQIGGTLGPQELVAVSAVLYASRQMKQFIEKLTQEEEVSLPHLEQLVSEIGIYLKEEKEIQRCIRDDGEIVDDASDKLKAIRGQIRTLEARIREKLESIIRSPSAQKNLSDAIITIRNDRYCIPVKQEYRGVYGGIVHDQSSSGATLFIEPQAIVEANNSLNEARIKERREIERILTELSKMVADISKGIIHNITVMGEIDFMFAKALYAKKLKATKPNINDRGIMKLYKARHPLIDPETVVPNTIELGEDFQSIVITGPNTGGKTVTLKTIGLLALMAQSGLQIPAEEGSTMPVFEAVYADIGDEQSIEQNLSTFSSHMVNIVKILQELNDRSLVLFDELGAGTDPGEGAALAIAILDEALNRGAQVVATTHYPELKAYGFNRKGVINASVEFDVDTLSPTYKLLIGVPGRSNAFEISKRLGLSKEIIERAKSFMSADRSKTDAMIASLEESKKRAEEDWMEAEKTLKEAEKLHKELQEQIIEFNKQKDRLYQEAEEMVKKRLEEAQKEADQIIQKLKNMQKEHSSAIKEHELIEAKKRLEYAAPEFINTEQKSEKQKSKKQLRPGDEVKVINLNQKGHLLEKANESEWLVQIGILKMKVKEEDLEYIGSPKQEGEKTLATVKGKDFHVSLELDLRGERYEDALIRLEKYIDDCLLAGYPRAHIIHGKGTGALRKGVREFLQNHRAVKNVRFGEANEGGTGVTIVEFK